MEKLKGKFAFPDVRRKPLVWRISLILLLLSGLEIIFRIFKCNLGEYYALFWINFIFLTFLFYWPTYFSANAAISQPSSRKERYRIFLTALLRAIFYLIVFSIILVIILAVFQKGINDTLLFRPLLVIWPIYTFLQVKRNFRQALWPFLISISTMILIQFTTPANPTLATFDAHLAAFEKVVAMLKSGEIKPPNEKGNSEIELPCEYRYLVGCPHRKISIQTEGDTNIIFFCSEIQIRTNRMTGFVYRSDHKDMAGITANQLPDLEVKKIKDHWFWQVESY